MTWHKWSSWEWPFVQKLALPKKDMTLQTITCGVCNKERASCWMSANLSVGKDTKMWTVSQHNPKKVKVWERQRWDLEKLICKPRWTNKEHEKQVCPLTHPRRVNEDQDVTQIDNNMQTFVMTKEQNRFHEGCINPRGCGKPKGKTFLC